MGVGLTARSESLSDTSTTRSVIFRKLAPDIPSTTHATFALYRYPAKFIPQIIAYILRKFVPPGALVMDPFAGYGTVGIVSRILGYPYVLWDLNPLLEHFHRVATMKPRWIAPYDLLNQVARYSGPPFHPEWSNIGHWHPEAFLPLLTKAWGFYHYQADEEARNLLLIPLLKATRYFSYDDEKVHKLYRSKRAEQKVQTLLRGDYGALFYKLLSDRLATVLRRLWEYRKLYSKSSPRSIRADVRGRVDVLSDDLPPLDGPVDALITSPPYLQSQEYIRTVKMDLLWLGYNEDEVRDLAKKEIPYRDVRPCPVYSETFEQLREEITEAHLRILFNRYFWGVLGGLERLQKRVRTYLFLFVGRASIRGRPIPIDRIFTEHFCALGWRHQVTLVDKIKARVMFRTTLNPANGLHNEPIPAESLIVLTRDGRAAP